MSIFTINAGTSAIPQAVAGDTLLNVAYGDNAAQRMDIYLPANRSADKTKSLILIHGGGWTNGSRHSLGSYIDSFKNRIPGYAIFNLDYRLIKGSTVFSAQESDIKTAIDFIATHSDKYEIDPGKLVLLGVSAGGHLALLQAYKNPSPKIAAVIDFFGPTDLTAMYNKPWNPLIPHLLETLIGGSSQSNAVSYSNASPVSFISAATPPTLIFHGKQDYIVNISQSRILHQKLEQAGVANTLHEYDAGHGWYGTMLSDSFDKIEVFLKENLL